MSTELWDLLDSNGNKTGATHERSMPLEEGQYHLVVSVWIKTPDSKYLITRRDLAKPYGGCWEVPGGCALAGEDSLTAALREAKEETGLTLNKEDGRKLWNYRRDDDFCDVWMFETDVKLSDVVLQEGETIDARLVTRQEIEELMKQAADLSLVGKDTRNVADGKFIPAFWYPYLEAIFKLDEKRVYEVPTLEAVDGNMPDWSQVPEAPIDIWLWKMDYLPKTKMQMALVNGGIAYRMTCIESEPKAVNNEYGMEVWIDSCMECFIGREYLGDYINAEINSYPNCLIGVGDGRADRRVIDMFGECPKCTSRVDERSWYVETYLTPELLTSVFGDHPHKGEVWYGNFFKVGEETGHPHYGMWSPIKSKEPDFHRPECFGKIKFI